MRLFLFVFHMWCGWIVNFHLSIHDDQQVAFEVYVERYVLIVLRSMKSSSSSSIPQSDVTQGLAAQSKKVYPRSRKLLFNVFSSEIFLWIHVRRFAVVRWGQKERWCIVFHTFCNPDGQSSTFILNWLSLNGEVLRTCLFVVEFRETVFLRKKIGILNGSLIFRAIILAIDTRIC